MEDLTDGAPQRVPATFLGVHYTKTEREKERINLFLSFDLSTHSKRTGLFYKGMFYDQREDMDISRKFSDFARTLRENADLMADLRHDGRVHEFGRAVRGRGKPRLRQALAHLHVRQDRPGQRSHHARRGPGRGLCHDGRLPRAW